MSASLSAHNLAFGFSSSVEGFSDRPALEVNNSFFSYAQLSRMAAVLSVAVKSAGVGDSALVACFAYRSSVAYAGILSILGSGYGYVPLHPDYPVERNLKIVDLSGIHLMIVSGECRDALQGLLKVVKPGFTFILVDVAGSSGYAGEYPGHRFICLDGLEAADGDLLQIAPVRRDAIAYLLFTSGSTGEPKGVPVSHHNVREYVKFITARYDINEYDRCSQMHDLTFDFSVHDIYPTWAKGACLCVAAKEDKLLPSGYIVKHRITSWASVPSVAVMIDKYGRLGQGIFAGLRYSFFCGEALYSSTAEKWQAAACNSKVINLYGPTEATMAISCYDWDKQHSFDKCDDGIVPIGQIFDGQAARVTAENGARVLTGETGELCLSGSQVTRGYWKNMRHTVTQYVKFSDEGDVLWYRTGDLVRQDPDGCLHYKRRIDNQAKILGNRVELGEIDKILRDATGVETAVAVLWPVNGGNASGVVGFVAGAKMDEAGIIGICRNRLPRYMVPARVCFIDDIPLNNNGKVDRFRLKQLLEEGL